MIAMTDTPQRSGSSMRRYALLLGVVLFLAGGAFAINEFARETPAEVAPSPSASVRLQLDWTHAPDFVGFYAADQNGLYEKDGLEVTFLPGGIKTDPTENVLADKAEFGLATAGTLLKARAAGKPVKAIACIYQRSPFAFATKTEDGIRNPKDFEGRTVRLSKQAIPVFSAMMTFVGADANTVTIIHTRDTQLFRNGEVDVWGAYVTSSIRRLGEAGLKLFLVYPDDYGVHTYHQCLFTTDRMIAERPEVVRRFLALTIEGWQYAADNIDEVAGLVERYGEIKSQREATAYARASLPLFDTGEAPIGYMAPNIWQSTTAYLQSAELLPQAFDPTGAYTLEFLEAARASESKQTKVKQ